MRQNYEVGKGVVAAPRSGRDNMGTREHDACHLSFLFKDVGTLFSHLILK